jgi:hypothetical protein
MIYQRHHHPPHEIWEWPKRSREFAAASDVIAIDDEKESAK